MTYEDLLRPHTVYNAWGHLVCELSACAKVFNFLGLKKIMEHFLPSISFFVYLPVFCVFFSPSNEGLYCYRFYADIILFCFYKHLHMCVIFSSTLSFLYDLLTDTHPQKMMVHMWKICFWSTNSSPVLSRVKITSSKFKK